MDNISIVGSICRTIGANLNQQLALSRMEVTLLKNALATHPGGNAQIRKVAWDLSGVDHYYPWPGKS